MPPAIKDRILNDFAFHPATDVTRPMHEQVRSEFLELAQALADRLPEGRELSLCITNLEEAMFWANAAIARNLAPLG